jgi:ATP-binding cassette subfamily B protein
MWPVAAIGWVTNLVQRASASTARIGVILDSAPIITDVQADDEITSIKGAIEFRNVSFRHETANRNSLTNISLTVPAGGSLGIVGATGSGKTTLVNLVPRLFDPTVGEVLIDSHSVSTIPLNVLRCSIGIVTQEPFLFSETIEDNIRAGNPNAQNDEVIAAAKAAQLHNDVHLFPAGYNTIVGERGVTLSGGQKQRSAIARALIRKPAILILDDALSAVDTATEHEILEHLRVAMQDCTALIVSHRLSAVQNCTNIAVIDEGMIAEYGTHEELLAIQGGLYAEMWEIQQLEEELRQA